MHLRLILLAIGAKFRNFRKFINYSKCYVPTYNMPFCVSPSIEAAVFLFGPQQF